MAAIERKFLAECETNTRANILDKADEVARHAIKALSHYGPYASVHEAMGVLLEEFHELVAAVHDMHGAPAPGYLRKVNAEAADLAAVALRLAVFTTESIIEFERQNTHEETKQNEPQQN